jgi:adenine-specific DNA-methyltransferase
MFPDIDKMARLEIPVGADLMPAYAALREHFPEAFSEEQVDLALLGAALGVLVDTEPERYGLSFPGKADAILASQRPSIGTLRPDTEKSVHSAETRNVMIEGDNLEVLRLLQRSYYEQVRLIFIDPPYNTGGDFIYPDDFRDSLTAYLEYTGQLDDAGNRKSSVAEARGRYHSRWLSMMYPRLSLARNLLADDGVIFITIDDNEYPQLRLMMDEVFGPENFLATAIWQKVYSPKPSAKHFSDDHDYVVIYARSAADWRPQLLPRTEEMEARYTNPDNDPRGDWKTADLSARNYYSKGNYPITTPSGRVIPGPPPGRYWTRSEPNFLALKADNRIWWGDKGDAIPQEKKFLTEVKQGAVPQTLWKYQDVGHTQEAKQELLRLVKFASSDSVFDTPKPTRLIRRMLQIATVPGRADIVLDFFAGSGTTGEAVMRMNAEDGGNRRFILVQLPEETGYNDYPHVSDITKARLDGASAALKSSGAVGDTGLRWFTLAKSSFKTWDGEKAADSVEALDEQLAWFVDNITADAREQDLLWEVILKSGIELSATVTETSVGGTSAYLVDGGRLLVALGLRGALTLEGAREIGGWAKPPSKVLVLNRSYSDDDSALTTIAIELDKANITLVVA